MKKKVFGRKLGRDKNERKALFKSLMSSFILSDRIQTTEAKAKAIRPELERLVTKAKSKENSAIRVLEKTLSKQAMERLIKDVAPSFAKRQGGYTRLIKSGKNRLGDNTTMVILEWTEIITQTPIVKKEKVKKLPKEKIVKKPVKKVKPETKKPAKKAKK